MFVVQQVDVVGSDGSIFAVFCKGDESCWQAFEAVSDRTLAVKTAAMANRIWDEMCELAEVVDHGIITLRVMPTVELVNRARAQCDLSPIVPESSG